MLQGLWLSPSHHLLPLEDDLSLKLEGCYLLHTHLQKELNQSHWRQYALHIPQEGPIDMHCCWPSLGFGNDHLHEGEVWTSFSYETFLFLNEAKLDPLLKMTPLFPLLLYLAYLPYLVLYLLFNLFILILGKFRVRNPFLMNKNQRK